MNIKTIGVVGAGTMGNGIVQVCAAAGLKVIMQDIGDAQVERGLTTIAGSLERLIKKEKISEQDKQATLANISTTTALGDLADTDIVIEAATENEAIKLDIFRQLDARTEAARLPAQMVLTAANHHWFVDQTEPAGALR